MKFDNSIGAARLYTACYVLLVKNEKVAMLLRENTGWMDGYYGLPAGRLEYDESFTQGAIREAKEESGVTIRSEDMRAVHVANRHVTYPGDKYADWVDVYFIAEKWQGKPRNAEPEKSERLDWLAINDLPDNIVPPQRAALTEIAKANFYSEFGWGNN